MKTTPSPKKADDTWGETPLFRPQVGLVNVNLNVDLRKSGVIAATLVALTLFFTTTTGSLERVQYAARFILALLEHPTFWMFAMPTIGVAASIGYGIRWWKQREHSAGDTTPSTVKPVTETIAPRDPKPLPQESTLMRIAGRTAEYDVLRRMGETATFTLYEGTRVSDTRSCIIKVAKTTDHNALLDREALVLTHLRDAAARLEEEYARIKKGPEMLNYHFCFPELLESFICATQGNRRISVLAFQEVADVKTLIPLRHIIEKQRARIDPRTSAWIMGKFLKVLAFVHDQGVTVETVTADNMLIEPAQHYIAFFDWSSARLLSRPDALDRGMQEVAASARVVIEALGGSYTTGSLPAHPDLTDRYRTLLTKIARNGYADASMAHTDFYSLIRELWPRTPDRSTFHPFTTIPL